MIPNYGLASDFMNTLFVGETILLFPLGIVLQSQLVMICAGIGLFIYLSYLSHEVFRNSLLFPLALSMLGIGLISAGIVLQKNEAALFALGASLAPDLERYYTFLETLTLPHWVSFVCWTKDLHELAVAYTPIMPLVVGGLGLALFLWSLVEKYFIEEPVRELVIQLLPLLMVVVAP